MNQFEFHHQLITIPIFRSRTGSDIFLQDPTSLYANTITCRFGLREIPSGSHLVTGTPINKPSCPHSRMLRRSSSGFIGKDLRSVWEAGNNYVSVWLTWMVLVMSTARRTTSFGLPGEEEGLQGASRVSSSLHLSRIDCLIHDHVFRDYQSKTKRLKELRKQALDKNPDEFYFHMINSQLKDGRHYEKNNVSEFTEDQLKIIQSRDLRYIEYKRSCEMAKIEKLKSTLHLIHVDEKPQNKRLVFTDDGKPKKVKAKTSKLVSDEDLSLGDPGWKERKKAYRELQKREDRLKQLTILSQKMSLKQHLNVSSFAQTFSLFYSS